MPCLLLLAFGWLLVDCFKRVAAAAAAAHGCGCCLLACLPACLSGFTNLEPQPNPPRTEVTPTHVAALFFISLLVSLKVGGFYVKGVPIWIDWLKVRARQLEANPRFGRQSRRVYNHQVLP